jgi:hypothetical protein
MPWIEVPYVTPVVTMEAPWPHPGFPWRTIELHPGDRLYRDAQGTYTLERPGRLLAGIHLQAHDVRPWG